MEEEDEDEDEEVTQQDNTAECCLRCSAGQHFWFVSPLWFLSIFFPAQVQVLSTWICQVSTNVMWLNV